MISLGFGAVLLIFAGCSFDGSSVTIGDDASDGASQFDAPVGLQIDATIGPQIDAGPFVCSTTSVMCPGNQPLRLLSCGDPADCWVGCRDGDAVSPDQAAAFCTSWGGRLANFDSLTEENCVRLTINGAIMHGLVQELGQASDDVGWSWNGDGQTPVYLNWDNGQPNDGSAGENNEEQCAYSNSSGNWHDTECNVAASARFTCRYP